MKNHIRWIDDLKGVAIFLIVFGHVLATFVNMTSGRIQCVSNNIFKFIYSFHVPLFFLVAGLTFSTHDNFIAFFKKKFFRLMIPYYAWGFFCAVLYAVMGQFVAGEIAEVSTTSSFASKTMIGQWYIPILSILHAGAWPDGKGFCFNGVLWFLPVLFCLEILYYWLIRLIKDKEWTIVLAAVALCILLWASSLINVIFPFNLPCLIRYFPFIAFGHWLSDYVLEKSHLRLNLPIVVASPIGGYFIMSRFFPIARNDAAYWVDWVFIALLLCVLLLFFAKLNLFCWFSFLAPWTIGIMLFHKFPLVLLQLVLGRYGQSILNNMSVVIILEVLISLGLILVCVCASRIIMRIAPWSLGVVFKNSYQ